jgi:hypothetical protein
LNSRPWGYEPSAPLKPKSLISDALQPRPKISTLTSVHI